MTGEQVIGQGTGPFRHVYLEVTDQIPPETRLAVSVAWSRRTGNIHDVRTISRGIERFRHSRWACTSFCPPSFDPGTGGDTFDNEPQAHEAVW